MLKGLPKIVYAIRSFFGEGVKSHLSGFFLTELLSPISSFEDPIIFDSTVAVVICETIVSGFLRIACTSSGLTVSTKFGSPGI
jgi:hypothetical protein